MKNKDVLLKLFVEALEILLCWGADKIRACGKKK